MSKIISAGVAESGRSDRLLIDRLDKILDNCLDNILDNFPDNILITDTAIIRIFSRFQSER